MITANKENKYVNQRKTLRNQIKQTDNENLKDNYRLQIEDSKIKQQEEILNKQKKESELKKQEIREEYYYLNDRLAKLYVKLGIVKGRRNINEMFNKSNNYFNSTKYQNHFPKIDLINDILRNIDSVIYNINALLYGDDEKIFNKQCIVNTLEDMSNRYRQLKLKIATLLYLD